MGLTEQFLAHVLPPVGPYCIASMTPGHKGMRHVPFDTMVQGVKIAMLRSQHGDNAYFSIASFLSKEAENPRTKKQSIRFKENAFQVRSLVLDVDIDFADERKYATQEEGLEGIKRLVNELSWPDPYLVNSGYGWHSYWPLKTPLEAKHWLQMATLWKSVVEIYEPKLVADSSRVTDCVGVLRVPETFNFKNVNEPKKVELVQQCSGNISTKDTVIQLREILKAHGARIPTARIHIPKSTAENSLLIDTKHDFIKIAKKCNQVKQYLINKHKESENIWYPMLGLVKHCETATKTSQQLAHLISEGHPGYDYAQTEAKFEQVKAAQDGPSTCELFRSRNPGRCNGCPYTTMVITPARLPYVDIPAPAPAIEHEVISEKGEVSIEAEPLPEPPKPYFRGKEGGIYIASQSSDTDDSERVKRIYEYDIFPLGRLQDEESGTESLQVQVELPRDGKRIISVPTEYLVDPKQFTKHLTSRGVLVHGSEANKLVTYLIEYAKVLQRREAVREEYTRFGWRDIDTNPKFVFPDGALDVKGAFHRASISYHLAQHKNVLARSGNLESWIDGFNVYNNRGDLAFGFTAQLGFVSALFELTPFHGMIYNMLGESGTGKSTALEITSSIWGKPNPRHLIVQDTAIARYNTLSYMHSIPVTCQELTLIPSDDLNDMAYMVSEGRGKNRANRSGQTRLNNTSWKTLILGSSNESMYGKLAMARQGNNAHAYRIFEVNLTHHNDNDREAIEHARFLCHQNYGHAGRIYMQYVITHINEIKERLAASHERIARRYRMATAERFWTHLLCCFDVASDITKELGLHNYDKEKYLDWAAKQLGAVRTSVHAVSGDPLSAFSDFLQTHLRATVYVKSDGTVMNEGNLLNELHVRYEQVNGQYRIGYISQPALKKYCIYNKIDYQWLIKSLQSTRIILDLNVNRRLGAGLKNMQTGNTKCIQIDLQHRFMTETIEEIKSE